MSDYKEGFQDGYIYAKEEIVEKLSEVEGLDSWTLEVICDMIERNKLQEVSMTNGWGKVLTNQRRYLLSETNIFGKES